jgi:class 3 adenylate cyclase
MARSKPKPTGPSADTWYSFHFGPEVACAPDFNPDALIVNSNKDCYVLLADLCSFTSFFKATHDLKLIERIMTAFYSRVRKVIHRHSGMLDKIIGDSVIAVWGLHHRDEKLIQQVIEASRELTRIANEVCEEWQSHIDLLVEPKGLRIGVSKGPIILIPRDFAYPGLSLLGNPINLASRLQAAAAANQLICSNQVYKDVEQARLKAKFKPYCNAVSTGFLEAKNYGPIKAWVMDLH